jgi:hypothetical protein
MRPLSAMIVVQGLLVAASPALADDWFDPNYPGSQVVADANGAVHVKVVYFANQACWSIAGAREGVPDRAADQPTGRDLYVNVNLTKTNTSCALTGTPLQTTLTIPDKPGKLSLDIFFVDDRGILVRSQRHRIMRGAI